MGKLEKYLEKTKEDAMFEIWIPCDSPQDAWETASSMESTYNAEKIEHGGEYMGGVSFYISESQLKKLYKNEYASSMKYDKFLDEVEAQECAKV